VKTPPRTIPFTKASACGNDFLLIEAGFDGEFDREFAPPHASELTRRICDRHDGIGADGVEWMMPHSVADVEIRLINADGSAAEISGNGTRCVAAHLCATRGKERISILTGAGLKICTMTARQESQYEFEIEMGSPQVGAEFAIASSGGDVRGVPVSMGNPHFVVFVPEFPADWQHQAAEIQRNAAFPQGVNVEYVVARGAHEIDAVFFERGVGETRSSGTGSCASATAAIATGRAQSPVKVQAPGGTQTVRTEGADLFLRGAARLVGRGEFLLT
jgi:diaminopimelate epimerase